MSPQFIAEGIRPEATGAISCRQDGIKGVNFSFQTSVEACLVADRVREPGMMPSYGVRKNLRDQSVVRLRGELHGQLRARCRMVHLQRGAFETALESRRIFAQDRG